MFPEIPTKFAPESTYWRYQRIISTILVPVLLWAITILMIIDRHSPVLTVAFLANNFTQFSPFLALLAALLVVMHIRLGLVEIIEDYIHEHLSRTVLIALLQILTIRVLIQLNWTFSPIADRLLSQ